MAGNDSQTPTRNRKLRRISTPQELVEWVRTLSEPRDVFVYVSFTTTCLIAAESEARLAHPLRVDELKTLRAGGANVEVRNWAEEDLPKHDGEWRTHRNLWRDLSRHKRKPILAGLCGVCTAAVHMGVSDRTAEVASGALAACGVFLTLFALFADRTIDMAWNSHNMRTTYFSRVLLDHRTLLRWSLWSVGLAVLALPLAPLTTWVASLDCGGSITPALEAIAQALVGFSAAFAAPPLVDVLAFLVNRQALLSQLAAQFDDQEAGLPPITGPATDDVLGEDP